MLKLEILPIKTALPENTPITLDVVVKLTPPEQIQNNKRSQLNVSLVLDRSGSMTGKGIEYAKKAATECLNHFQDGDRASVVIFDDKIDVLCPSTLISRPSRVQLQQRIRTVTARGSTDLHGGWFKGGFLVSEHYQKSLLNRVMLLSDGQANVGITDRKQINQEVLELSEHGVSTSTFGMGDDYDEDLLMGMADAGGGNYHYVSNPEMLPAIFEEELKGLESTFARRVSLGITVHSGVTLDDVLNRYATVNTGRYRLPNLRYGQASESALRFRIPELPAGQSEVPLMTARVAFDRGEERVVVKQTLSLKVVPVQQYDALPENMAVKEYVTLLEVTLKQEETVVAVAAGEQEFDAPAFMRYSEALASLPASPRVQEQMDSLNVLAEQMKKGDLQKARKESTYRSFARRKNQNK
ncbi:vWA domain-containing protein [Deinococcus roseus]|uniref:VWFA domain-containing protein n=1 Tax=Deinococcus roseus TaxID=392414 RepID=A0ABQ2CTB8_9DEIO|nr:VWA domain-containing protein [Deinococcus roseus]GGJ18463.1 hypothetical protein GCM10008938_00750 [Deinococcus roseus]